MKDLCKITRYKSRLNHKYNNKILLTSEFEVDFGDNEILISKKHSEDVTF